MTKKTNKKRASETTSSSVAIDERPARPSVFEPLERLHLADWFDRWPDMFARRWPESFQDLPFGGAAFRMERLVEDDGTVVVRSELPGLDPDEDVDITIENDRLTISGSREERSEETENGTRKTEFHYGSFQRSVSLPSGALRDEAVATYDNGILEVRIPVASDPEAVRTVPITTAG